MTIYFLTLSSKHPCTHAVGGMCGMWMVHESLLQAERGGKVLQHPAAADKEDKLLNTFCGYEQVRCLHSACPTTYRMGPQNGIVDVI